MVYESPSLFGILTGEVQLYIDGIFKICPSQFYQCLMIIVFDLQTLVYVPVFYVLMMRKMGNLYWHVLYWVSITCQLKLDPFFITSEFENVSYNIVCGQFNKAIFNGHLFHREKEIRRKMIEMKIEKNKFHQP